MDLAEFLYTALLYQAMTNRNINTATLLEQYFVLVEKNKGLFTWLVTDCITLDLGLDLFLMTKTKYMLKVYVY